MEQKRQIVINFVAIFALTASVAHSQMKPSVQQRAEKSPCSNIVALAGNVDIKCSSLTPAEEKIIADIPAVLHKILASELDTSIVMQKLEEVRLATQEMKRNPPDANRGILLPGKDANPFVDDWCEANIPKDWFRLYLGGYFVASPGFPVGGIVIRGKQVVSFRQHDGGIGVSATVSSPDGKRVVTMRDNFFKLDDYFRRESPDDSTLNVFDDVNDQPILHVRFLNPKAILLTGRFSERGLTVTIDDKDIKTDAPNSNIISGGCAPVRGSSFEFH